MVEPRLLEFEFCLFDFPAPDLVRLRDALREDLDDLLPGIRASWSQLVRRNDASAKANFEPSGRLRSVRKAWRFGISFNQRFSDGIPVPLGIPAPAP